MEFRLPDPGEGLVEAEIVEWKVTVGDVVAVNDILLEIETAKSLVELPSPFAGVVQEILAPAGQLVPVGTPIIRIGADEPAPASAVQEPAKSATPVAPDVPADAPHPAEKGTVPFSADAPQGSAADPSALATVKTEDSGAVLVGYGTRTAAVTRRARRHEASAPAPGGAGDASGPVLARNGDGSNFVPPATSERNGDGSSFVPPRPATADSSTPARAEVPRAKPPVRRVARDLGVDLAGVVGTGPDGTITAADVLTAAGRPPENPAEQRIPLRGVRRAMFQSMTASLAVPQATAFVEVDVTATMQLIETLRRRRDFTGLKVSPLVIFAKAACLAIERVPEINSRYDAATDEMVIPTDVNLGIAAATPRGLVVPNIKRANQLNLLELTRGLNEMVALAREGRVQPSDLAGGTFSITNVGVFGVDGGTPIMNNGEAAIMCLGTILRKPWVVGEGDQERIEPRSVCTVSLTFDHRLVDGEMGSKFLADVSTIMADPALALLF